MPGKAPGWSDHFSQSLAVEIIEHSLYYLESIEVIFETSFQAGVASVSLPEADSWGWSVSLGVLFDPCIMNRPVPENGRVSAAGHSGCWGHICPLRDEPQGAQKGDVEWVKGTGELMEYTN